ncbi:T9SS type A sorting domain-containing protein [Lewinella sp. W8]|uniref:T9SS type A sorting domain-containing protein n=1 Tax=Lewinella sp. W8 TaxID=2528208 RepID=UPI0010680DD1|nr:T9SS type A sorting domain-containing protein [Lewinella sp. W8]MTB52082.1 T9SS type A sorting domain-containing protein [Lewinella sp. W8]
MKKLNIIPFLLFINLCPVYSQTQIGQTLTEFAADDTFGASVAINDAGNRILTSAPRFNTNGVDLAGRADAYQLEGDRWVPLGSTLEGVPTVVGLFGQGLDMSASGNRIALGNNNAQPQVYEWNEAIGDWEQMGEDLEFPGQPDADCKTFRFTQDENTLVVGATGSGSESVSQFQWNGTNWIAVGNPLEVPVQNELAISDNAQTVAVLFRENRGANGIRIYTFNGTDWSLQFTRTFSASIIVSDGFDLSADGTRIVLSYGDDQNAASGVTFETYDLIGGDWVKEISDLNVTPLRERNNALRMSADGTTFIVGTGMEGGGEEGAGTRIYQQRNNAWELAHYFDYDNYDESILGNVDITPDGSKVVFGRSRRTNVGFVEVYEISEVLGTSEFDDHNYTVYPNPTTGHFKIDADNKERVSRVVITDVTGKVVREVSSSAGHRINDSNLELEGEPGLYFVTIFSTSGGRSFKLLKI